MSQVINGTEQGNNDDYEEIEEGALATSRYSSFTTKKPSRAWGLEETRIFYNVGQYLFFSFMYHLYTPYINSGTPAMRDRFLNVAIIFSKSHSKRVKNEIPKV